MGAGQQLGFPLVAAAFNGETHQHGFHVGARVEDIEKLLFRHGRHPIAFLIDHRHQPLGHQLRKRLAQRTDPQAIARRQQAHPQLLIGVVNPADDVVF